MGVFTPIRRAHVAISKRPWTCPVDQTLGDLLKYDPYQIPASRLGSVDKELTCPYCAAAFSFTWKRYFRIRQQCPRCRRKSKFKTGLVYWVVYVPLIAGVPPATAFVGTAIISMVLIPDDPLWIAMETHVMAGLWAILYLLSLPIDRAIDLHFRRLEPIGGS